MRGCEEGHDFRVCVGREAKYRDGSSSSICGDDWRWGRGRSHHHVRRSRRSRIMMMIIHHHAVVVANYTANHSSSSGWAGGTGKGGSR